MAEKTRTCPECHGSMVLRLGEYQCQQCGTSLPPGEPEEPAHGGGYGAPAYGSRSGGYGEIGSSLGGGQRSSKLPPAPPPPGGSDPGAQYRSAPPAPPPPNAAASYATAGVYGGATESRGGSLDTEKKIFIGLQCLWLSVNTVIGFMGSGLIGILTLGIGAVVVAIYYWVLNGPEVWSKWTCTGCLGIGLIGTLVNMFSGATYLHMVPQLQGFSDHALQSFMLVAGLLQLLWSGWIISILVRDALHKQQGY